MRRSQDNAAGLGPVQKTDASVDLSGPDLQTWLEVLSALPAAPVTESDILAWVEGPLRKFFPFEKFLGAYGGLSGGMIRMRSLVTSGYPQEFLSTLEDVFDRDVARMFFVVGIQAEALLSRRDRRAGRARRFRLFASKRELEELKRFALGAVAAHGVIDPYAKAGTYISFAGVPRTRHKRTLAALDLIAPVLHSLFMATKQPEKAEG